VAGLIWLGASYAWTRKLEIPKLFILFGLLVFGQAVALMWADNRWESLRQVLLLASGGMWWAGAASWRRAKGLQETVWRSIVAAGCVMLLLWAAHTLTGWPARFYGPSSLIVEASMYQNHNHLGDWWMIILVGVIWAKEWWGVLPVLAMILISRSRSAVLGVLAGMGYIAFAGEYLRRYRKVFVAIGLGLGLIFAIQGTGKITLGARDFYIQSIAGLKTYPLGVGLGNFGVISRDAQFHWWGRGDLSLVVHNVLLEWTSGAGWLGLVGWIFIGWLSWRRGFKAAGLIGKWRAVYWAMLINFLFDSTYLVPSMWWIFMIVVGLSGAENET
jgi:hypothetical protein